MREPARYVHTCNPRHYRGWDGRITSLSWAWANWRDFVSKWRIKRFECVTQHSLGSVPNSRKIKKEKKTTKQSHSAFAEHLLGPCWAPSIDHTTSQTHIGPIFMAEEAEVQRDLVQLCRGLWTMRVSLQGHVGRNLECSICSLPLLFLPWEASSLTADWTWLGWVHPAFSVALWNEPCTHQPLAPSR